MTDLSKADYKWFRAKLDDCRRVPRDLGEGDPVILKPNASDIFDVEVYAESDRRIGRLFSRAAVQVQEWLRAGKPVRATIWSI